MCDIGKALSKVFNPGSGALMNALQGQQAQADASASTASNALTQALAQMKDASLPMLDNPSALAAQKDQMRKLLGQRGGAFTFGSTPTAAPAVGTKLLMGA